MTVLDAPVRRVPPSANLPQTLLVAQFVASLIANVLAAHELQVPAVVRPASPTARLLPTSWAPQTVLVRQFA